MLTVIQSTRWHRRFGNPQTGGGIEGQVTYVRVDMPAGPADAYVRENVRVDTFVEMTSNRRRGVAEGADMPGVQVLELATDGPWHAVLAAIAAADPMRRPVVANRSWTTRAARALLGGRRGAGGAA